MRESNKLTPQKISKLTKPGRYADGGNLYLQVSPSGTKSWLFRYMKDGTSRSMGLGSLADVDLAEAREAAQACRRDLHDRHTRDGFRPGVDPLEAKRLVRQAQQLEAAQTVTFKAAATEYIKTHRAAWRSEKHLSQWEATLRTYAYPVFGDASVGSINQPLVMQVLQPLWQEKTETASRLRGRIESILDWATVSGFRQGENPARWRGFLEKALPARAKIAPVRHLPSMPYGSVPAFLAELRGRDGSAAHALELTILCATRTAETLGACWPEFDLKAKLWTIPAYRTGRKIRPRAAHPAQRARGAGPARAPSRARIGLRVLRRAAGLGARQWGDVGFADRHGSQRF